MHTGRAYAGVGIMEMPEDLHPEETILGIIWTHAGIRFTGEKIPLASECAYWDTAGLVTSLEFPAPPEWMGMGGGGLILRQMRHPASTPGYSTYNALLVCRNTPRNLDHKTIYDLAETPMRGLALSASCELDFEPNGMALSQISKAPIWGWDDEPWGINSTLALSAIDEAQAYQDREDAGIPHPDDLSINVRSLFYHYRDKEFLEFTRKMKAAGHNLRWDATPTKTQTEKYEEAANAIIRDILNRNAA